jgi:hypothetical protein
MLLTELRLKAFIAAFGTCGFVVVQLGGLDHGFGAISVFDILF